MPIEIRELVIRATVNPGAAGGCGTSSAPSAGAHSRAESQTRPQDDLVQTCIHEVLRILEEKRER
jgi:hypothetical protein